MKSKFAITLIASLVLFLGVGSLSHAAKIAHTEKYELISQLTADVSGSQIAFDYTPATISYEIDMTEYRPLAGIVVIKIKSVNRKPKSVSHLARDGLS